MTTLFHDGFESGSFNAWDIISASGFGNRAIQSEIVHSGRYAARLTIRAQRAPEAMLAAPGVRLGYHGKKLAAASDPANLPDAAYYSCWYYLPEPVETAWLNLMQWKQARITSKTKQTRDPVAFVCLRGQGGVMSLSLRYKVAVATGRYVEPGMALGEDLTPVPVGEWFELRSLYVWSKTAEGRIATWLNDRLLWDVAGIQTEFDRPYHSYPRQWAVNNYAARFRPSPYTIFVDDCRVWTIEEPITRTAPMAVATEAKGDNT